MLKDFTIETPDIYQFIHQAQVTAEVTTEEGENGGETTGGEIYIVGDSHIHQLIYTKIELSSDFDTENSHSA